ncbi:MAG: ABC transporter permease [Erysipelothrix sp.]|nr:ABC transporter permease [Erysipelothrix sp.]
MKHLIQFALSRRFKNKVTILLHVLTITLMSAVFFADKIIVWILPHAQEQTIIYYPESLESTINDYIDENFRFERGYESKAINIIEQESIIIESEFALDPIVQLEIHTILTRLISEQWLNQLNDQAYAEIINNISPEINFVTLSENNLSQDKMNMSMFLITGIYFAMLSFSTMIANEVVYEKTSKVLSMILTSISTTEHFISKMIVAWLTVTIQTTMVVAEIVSIMMLRNLYDEGHGLLKILSRYKLIQTPALTFQSFIEHLDIDARLITILAISLLYMFVGIILVQIIMVCLSSFITSIEESSGLHAPVYIIFLVIYYIALALNSPLKLSQGLGYYFSMTPILSMLFMPMRLMLMRVSMYEILLGLLLNLISLVIFLYIGSKIYNLGILGGFSFRKYHLKSTKNDASSH